MDQQLLSSIKRNTNKTRKGTTQTISLEQCWKLKLQLGTQG